MDKPQPVEYVPIVFAFMAVIIVESMLFFHSAAPEAAIQGAISIATTLAGAAAGTYKGKTPNP